ncbi:MAG: hypothetical protein H8E60_09345 [Candidatus Marinimicrobia bacterium]|nr:hypothetical protein [Candidatus Neomarinimicrobiota bacterium]
MKKLIILSIICIAFTGCKLQTRAFSRLTGSALQLQLPTDFAKPISFASGRKGEKDLFYWTTNNEMKVKTYTDYGILESEIVFVNK